MTMSMDGELATLLQWVRTESPTHNCAAVNMMMDLVVADVAGLPISVERLPGRDGLGDALILRAGAKTTAPPTLLLAHLDTVHPVGTAANGLPIRIEGDRLYGPGVYDMKGGAYLALQAFKEVAQSNSRAQPLTFLFTPDEEIGSPTSRAVIEDLARSARAALVVEPARDGGKIVTSRKGVGRFDVEVIGKAAHAGLRHREGRNAIHEAARLITIIAGMTDYRRGVTTTVGMINSGTAVNTIPPICRFPVDLRIESIEDADAVTAAVRALTPSDPGFELEVSGGLNRPPFERTPGTEHLFALARSIASDLGIELGSVDQVGGGSDGNFTAALGIPTLDGLGIDGDGAHTFDEYALISSIHPRQNLLMRLLETL
ncbi:M20/M25/M40 family metallo-hydrolase [Hyphomicrobiales bacterium]|nr:M20/M25/M40 family metallo-hydrolase [Hyphomicrobiales bacterium]CAH1692890.1 M20/M25/M40 family metallo-hydrolase [Hyphomicrobiales bacterium]